MEYLIHLAILISIWSILSISLNLVLGYTGLLSIAQAAFFGLGAYATAILTTAYGVNFFLSVLIGIAITGIISLVFGLILSRFNGDIYALASLGLNIIVFSIFLNWQEVTRGPLGIPGIGRPEILNFVFSSNVSFLILIVFVAFLIYLISEFIVNSSFGRVLQGIREKEAVVEVLGYRAHYFKLTIFVISACMAAVAGSFFASYITFIDPSTFSLNESIFILAIVILGGLANNKGAFIGTVFLILLPELLRFIGLSSGITAQIRQAVYGLLLVLLMMYRPQGLLGKFKL